MNKRPVIGRLNQIEERKAVIIRVGTHKSQHLFSTFYNENTIFYSNNIN